MAYLALDPVSAAVFTLLNVASLTSLATGGISDVLPPSPSFPYLWYEVQESDKRGFGTGGLPEVVLRLHTYTNRESLIVGQQINGKAIELLRDQALTVSGYRQCGRIFYDDTIPLPDEELNGVPVHELVSSFRIYVEEA